MLAFYEIGVLVLDQQVVRNAADVWLRQLLDMLGFTRYFFLPVLTCGLLLAWHHVAKYPWRMHWGVLYGMLLESLVFGFLLVLIAGWQRSLFSAAFWPCAQEASGGGHFLRLLVGYVGAGIYEELLFRLLLLSSAVGLLRLSGLSLRASWIAGVIATSLLFSAAHYQVDIAVAGWHFQTSYGESFAWSSFLFRFLAGVFFSVLFLFRGFGIAAGSHAVYDWFTLIF